MRLSSILIVLAFASSAFTIPLAAINGNTLQARDAVGSVIDHVNTFDERGKTRLPKVSTHSPTKAKPKTKTTPPKIGKQPKTKPKTTQQGSKPKPPKKKNPVNLQHTSHPQVGDSGAWYDPNEKVTKVFFGDDLKVHGAHVAHHDAQYPTHAGKTYKIAKGASRSDKNGEWYNNGHEALHDLKTGPGKQQHTKDPKTGKSIDRFDEKPWASLSRENDHKVSVVRVPKGESSLEGSMAKYAKRVHNDNAGSQGIKIIDNRTNKIPLDPKLILKKRDLLADMKSKATSIIGSAKNKTEQLMDEIENDWDSFRSKMETIIEPVLSEVDWVGENFAGFLKQDTSPDDHQLGIFWHGMNAYDDVMAATANSTDPADRAWYSNTTNLAYEVAALQLHNVSSHSIETALAPMLKALDEWNNGSEGSASNSTSSDGPADDESDDSDGDSDGDSDDDDLPSNSTIKATARMIPVDLSLAPTGTFVAAYASSTPSQASASDAIDTTCTEEQPKATSSSVAVYSSAPAATSSTATSLASSATATSQTNAAATIAVATTPVAVGGYGLVSAKVDDS